MVLHYLYCAMKWRNDEGCNNASVIPNTIRDAKGEDEKEDISR